MLIVGVHVSGKNPRLYILFVAINIAYLLRGTAQNANDVFAWIFQ